MLKVMSEEERLAKIDKEYKKDMIFTVIIHILLLGVIIIGSLIPYL